MDKQVQDLLSSPLVGFAVALILLVLGWRMTTTWANGLLAVAWAILVASVFRMLLLATLPVLPRMLWTGCTASLIGLGIYYALWTDISRIKITFIARTSSAVYPAGTTLAGILWRPAFTELRLFVRNPSKFDYADIDITVRPDEPAVEVGQASAVPNVSFWRLPDVTLAQELVEPSGRRLANPLVPLASTHGYRVRCELLPADSVLEIVLALAKIRDKPIGPIPQEGGIFRKDYVLRLPLADGDALWFAQPDKSDVVFLPGATPKRITINGTFTVREHKQEVADTLAVADVIGAALPQNPHP